MAKKQKRSRTSDFSLGDNKNLGALPTKDQINSVVAKATDQKGVVHAAVFTVDICLEYQMNMFDQWVLG